MEHLEPGGRGDRGARDRLIEQVMEDLKGIARAHLRRYQMTDRRRETSVVNDAVLRVLNGRGLDMTDRAQFFALMKAVMQSVLVDDLRKNDAQKNGGGWSRVPLIELRGPEDGREILPEELVAAFAAMERVDPGAAQVFVLVEVYGSTIAGAAEVVGRTYAQARGDYQYAGSWLKRYLRRSACGTENGRSR